MKRLILLYFLLILSTILPAQTSTLNNFEVSLVGPNNTDRHHPDQIAYYLDYFGYLAEEVDIFLVEIKDDLSIINKKNRKRLERQRPVRAKDYPTWKRKNQLVKSLEEDKNTVQAYIKLWGDFDYTKPDSVARVFMNIFEQQSCFDLISEQLVLAPKEYKISVYEADNGFFDWNEFIIKEGFSCPKSYKPLTRSTCTKNIEIEVSINPKPVFIVQNLLNNMPFHLDGFKRITCR